MQDEILSDVLEECEDDYVGLWSLHWCIDRAYPTKSPDERRSLTLELVQKLLEAGMLVGEFSAPNSTPEKAYRRVVRVSPEHRFGVWNMSAVEALQRIRREWAELGREPSLGDIAWFTSPRLVDAVERRMGSDAVHPPTKENTAIRGGTK